MMEKKNGFDLADLLKNVSELDTGNRPGREQIEYIALELLDADPANFYELSKIDALASNIALIGLQQPLRVKPNPEAPGRWRIVSGHRRRAALQKLVDEGREDLKQIACIKERGEGSDALQELRLIYANSDTRKMSQADISRQVLRIEQLLYQLKEEGYEFPGRMRDHVAEVCKVSRSKIARLKVIRENLGKIWHKRYERNELAESCAYALAQLPAGHQKAMFEAFGEGYISESFITAYGKKLAKIDELQCKVSGFACSNKDGKYRATLASGAFQDHCSEKCCSNCEELASCRYACPKLAERVKQLKADRKEQRKQEQLAQEEKDRPVILEIQKYWNRFGQARAAADASVKDAYNALRMLYSNSDADKVTNLECLEAKFTINTPLPYGYGCRLEDVYRYVRIADLFGCSLDYLLCRTDDPRGLAAAAEAAAAMNCGMVATGNRLSKIRCALRHGRPAGEPLRWIPGAENPPKPMLATVKFCMDGMAKPLHKVAWFDGSTWRFSPGGPEIGMPCAGWCPLPEEE